jgi:hypothetical protein
MSLTHEFECKFDEGFLAHMFLNTAMTKSAMDSFYSEAHFKIDYGFLPHTFLNSSMTTSAMESSYTRNHYKIDEDVQKNTSNTKSAMNFPTRPKPKASCLPTAQRQKLNGNYLMPKPSAKNSQQKTNT